MAYLDECDEVLDGLDDLGDGQILEHVLADADDLAHLRLVKGEQQRGGALQDACRRRSFRVLSGCCCLPGY